MNKDDFFFPDQIFHLRRFKKFAERRLIHLLYFIFEMENYISDRTIGCIGNEAQYNTGLHTIIL